MRISPDDRDRLAPLFRDVLGVPAVVACVLEGHLGVSLVDDAAHPRVARLDLGCYAIFGGDASVADATRLVDGVPPRKELIFPDSDEWRELLRRVHGPRLSPRPMQAYATAGLDVEHVRRLADEAPAGVQLRRIDTALAGRLGPDLHPHAMQVFETAEKFVERGVGFCALSQDDPRTPVCAATSYAHSARRIELAIATHPGFRGRGLATCVAARLMLHCLERGIVPDWNAANPVSQHLAERLGYRPEGICEVLYLD